MRLIDIIYRKIKDRWNHQRALMNASREELEFLVNLLDIIEANDDETDDQENMCTDGEEETEQA